MSALAPRPAEQIARVDVAAVVRCAAQERDEEMIRAMVSARDQATAGGRGRAGLDAVVTFNVEQAIGVVPGHGAAGAR